LAARSNASTSASSRVDPAATRRRQQAAALTAWRGDPSKVEEAQKAFYRRAKFNSAARSGTYAPEWETAEVA